MNTQTAAVTFRALRSVEILIVFICFMLEIVEYSAFQKFYLDKGFAESDYFRGGISKSTKDENLLYYNGAKVFYYIVLILTLVDGGFFTSRFCQTHRYSNGPFKRDITINAFFTTLWFISGIANVYPSFTGNGYTCENMDEFMARECEAKVVNISLGWINGFLFLSTTLLALKLWKERKERYEGERRVEALGEVVYKYKPRPNTIVQLDEPKQVMTYKTISKHEKKRGTQTAPTYFIRTSHSQLLE